jgi:FAD:protein FMN transferase
MNVYQHSTYAMGTRFILVIPGIDTSLGQRLGQGVNDILIQEERRLSHFLEDSEISFINRNAYWQSVPVSPTINQILDICQDYYHKTEGAFDAALLEMNSGIQSTLESVGEHGWATIQREGNNIKFTSEATGIDLGGFGKGWAMKKITDFLLQENTTSAFISFGESTLSVIGQHPLGNAWQVEIPNPYTGNSLTLHLANESISLSGLKIKYSPEGNILQPHIYSHHNSTLVQQQRIVLARSIDPLKAEILSTALIASGDLQKIAIFDSFPDVIFYECHQSDWKQATPFSG